MVNLIARPDIETGLPHTVGGMTLSAHDPGAITAVMPFAGQGGVPGFEMPGPNRTTAAGAHRAVWAGRDMALVLGAPFEWDGAACVDQTDGWALFDLSGEGGADVLARLCPVDVRPAILQPGQCARTLLGHMNAIVIRVDETTLRIMVFRSMARTALHDLTRAMEHAARAQFT